MSELVLGVKCGGSDAFSRLSAKPAVGKAADILVLEIFEYRRRVSAGEELATAEVMKHREFQVWAESAVSL